MIEGRVMGWLPVGDTVLCGILGRKAVGPGTARALQLGARPEQHEIARFQRDLLPRG